MSDSEQVVVNRLLCDLRSGNREAFSELFPIVHGELHRIAGRQRQNWDGEETLDTTALLHEAYLRLADQTSPQWESYPHFLAVASTAMRQILLDYAKRRHAAKRGGEHQHIPLHEIERALVDPSTVDDARAAALIALDESLDRLKAHNPMHASIVECRFFGGMTIDDTAIALGISPATVGRGWALAKAWLYADLKESLTDQR